MVFEVPSSDQVDDPSRRRPQMFRRSPTGPVASMGRSGRPREGAFSRLRRMMSGMRGAAQPAPGVPPMAGSPQVSAPAGSFGGTDAGVIDRQPAVDVSKFGGNADLAAQVGGMARPFGGRPPMGPDGRPMLRQFADQLPRSGPVSDLPPSGPDGGPEGGGGAYDERRRVQSEMPLY
jgi:hypothetical protein